MQTPIDTYRHVVERHSTLLSAAEDVRRSRLIDARPRAESRARPMVRRAMERVLDAFIAIRPSNLTTRG